MTHKHIRTHTHTHNFAVPHAHTHTSLLQTNVSRTFFFTFHDHTQLVPSILTPSFFPVGFHVLLSPSYTAFALRIFICFPYNTRWTKLTCWGFLVLGGLVYSIQNFLRLVLITVRLVSSR